MIAVTVKFDIHSQHLETFNAALAVQARNSLDREPGCHQFDVAFDPASPTRIFLYETYDDRDAFDLHLASEHFQQFDAATRDWIAGKSVAVWQIAD